MVLEGQARFPGENQERGCDWRSRGLQSGGLLGLGALYICDEMAKCEMGRGERREDRESNGDANDDRDCGLFGLGQTWWSQGGDSDKSRREAN